LGPFRDGQRWAFERVYRAYVRELDAYLRSLARRAQFPELEQPSAVADSLQEVFVRAFAPAARAAYDGERPYGPYLRKIAKNYFVDQLRARGRKLELSDESLCDHAAETEEVVVDPRVNAVLTAYLAALPDALRGVYEQRFVLGNSQEYACSALGITRRRLRTDESRLKSGLRKALASDGILRGDLTASTSLVRTAGSLGAR
jgi:RNA polymerase sigma factor (sigma-70 family)